MSKPSYIFAITYKNASEKQKKFQDFSKSQKTFWGFHGSRLENFYSILYHGLLKTLFKVRLFSMLDENFFNFTVHGFIVLVFLVIIFSVPLFRPAFMEMVYTFPVTAMCH